MKKLFILALISLWACQSSEPVEQNLRILGHRGGGIQYGFIENTVESAKYGCMKSDGIEVDLRLSSDGSWMVWHDDLLIDSNQDSFRISETHSKILEEKSFQFEDSLIQIQSLDQFLNEVPLQGKTLSLDVKWWGRRPNTWYTDEDIDLGIQSLKRLVKKFPANYLLEIDHKKFHKKLAQEIPEMKRFFIGFSSFEEGLKTAKDWRVKGLSISYSAKGISKEAIEKANQEGYEIMIWTPKDSSSFQEAISLKPNYIQTDYFLP